MNDEEPQENSFSFVDKRRSSCADDDTGSAEETASSNEETTGPVERTASSSTEPTTPAPPGPDEKSEAPPVDFATFIISLYSNSVYNLGGHQDPVSGKTSLNLDLAKQNIDLIAVLQKKTKGNLTDEEERLVEHTLYDLRMKFVEATKTGSST